MLEAFFNLFHYSRRRPTHNTQTEREREREREREGAYGGHNPLMQGHSPVTGFTKRVCLCCCCCSS
jgi:hypothetical protein